MIAISTASYGHAYKILAGIVIEISNLNAMLALQQLRFTWRSNDNASNKH